MGVLSAAGGMGGEPPPAEEPEEQGSAAPAPDEPAAAPPAEDAAPSDYAPARRRGSRRAQAAEEFDERIKTHLGDFEKRWTSERLTPLEQRLAAAEQERARLAGQLEAMQRTPALAPAPERDTRPDPAELRRQSKKALDERDFDTYERLRDEAAVIESDRRFDERISKFRNEIQQQIPQQVPPQIQFLLARHQNVALAGPRGVQAVMVKDQELALLGTPAGPERVAKAFELAEKMLAPARAPARPAYSSDAAAALSAIPAGRPAATGGGGGGDTGEPLSPLEKDVARSMKMTEADYKKWKSPEKFIKR